MGTNQITPLFYRLPKVKASVGVSGGTIWDWVKKGTFPAPVRLGPNAVAWRVSDIEAWAQARIEASHGKEAV